MKVKIEIETKTFVRFLLVVVGFIAAVQAIMSAKQALIILGISFFLAVALNGPVNKLASIMPGKSRVGGTALAYAMVLLFIGAFTFLVVPPVVEQSAKVAASIPTFVEQVQTQGHGLYNFARHYGLEGQLNAGFDSIKDNASDWAKGLAANVGDNIISSVGSLFGFLVATFLVIVLTFLMLVEAPRWLNNIWEVYNDDERMKHHRSLVHKMHSVVSGFVTGQLVIAGLGGFFAGATVFILSFIFNVPYTLAMPTAAIVFILSLIPMFGATIAGVIVSLLLAFNDLTAGIIFAVYFVIYQQIENNFINPTVQSRTVELSPLTILASVTIGIYVFGVAGGIISIPIAGCIKVLIEDYLAHAKKHRKESKNPLHKLAKKLQEES